MGNKFSGRMSGVACLIASVFAASAAHGRTVNAADFGYSAVDSTAALQAAIDSGAEKVVVDASRGDWCINPVKLRSNLELVFAENVKVRAVPGAYKSTGCKMFNAKGVTNLIIRGEAGASLSMCKRDYLDETRYKWSEWRHLLALYDCTNVAIKGISVSHAGGDGLYVNNCANLFVEDALFIANNRQGISVISVDGMTVRRCRFTATDGTPPACGLDFEPNRPHNRISSVVIEDCEFDGNFSSGATMHLVRMDKSSPPVSVTYRRCRFTGNGLSGFRVHPSWTDDNSVTGEVVIDGCLFAANVGGAIGFAWMPPSGFRVKVRNSIIDCRGCAAAPVIFDNGIAHYDFGGVEFENVKVLANTPDVVEFHGMTGVGITNVAGIIDVQVSKKKSNFSLAELAKNNPPDPAARAFKQASVESSVLKPASGAEKVQAEPFFCRGTSHFVQYSPSAGERKIRFHLRKPEGMRVNPDVTVTVFDKKGTLVESFKLESPETDYVLKSSIPNVHTFKIVAKRNRVAVESPWNGRGVLANSRILLADMEGKSVHFRVPAKSKGFKLEFLVKKGNSLKFKILDPEGNVKAGRSLADKGCFTDIKREPTADDEVWTLAVEKSAQPFNLRFGGDVTPVIFDNPSAGLRE